MFLLIHIAHARVVFYFYIHSKHKISINPFKVSICVIQLFFNYFKTHLNPNELEIKLEIKIIADL